MRNGTMTRQAQGELLPIGGDMPLMDGGTMQRMQGRYSTAISVQKPRVLANVQHKLLEEATLAGSKFFYGWGAGKDRIEGANINLATSIARIWGNCAVELQPVQDVGDSWIFTAAFVDLETGFTLSRQFRQSKSWVVHGKFDEARKEDIRFQIGQSKAIRNVILNVMPDWLIDKAIERAKDGVREELEEAIQKINDKGKDGLETVRAALIDRLGKQGVSEAMIVAKFGRPTAKGLTVEDLVIMRGDFDALSGGADTVEHLYPTEPPAGRKPGVSKSDALADELEKKRKQSEPEHEETHEPGPSGEESQEPPFEANTAEASAASGMNFASLESAITAATTSDELNEINTARKGASRASTITVSEAAKLDGLIKAKRKEIGA